MSTLYDTGWVLSGSAVSIAVDTSRCSSQLKVVFAASGSSGATGSYLSASTGLSTMTPVIPGADRTAAPILSGILTSSNVTAGTVREHVLLGSGYIPDKLVAGIIPGPSSASYARIIVEGK